MVKTALNVKQNTTVHASSHTWVETSRMRCRDLLHFTRCFLYDKTIITLFLARNPSPDTHFSFIKDFKVCRKAQTN